MTSEHGTWAGLAASLARVVEIDTTREECVEFLKHPPVWEVAHLTGIAWVLDPARSQLLLVQHRLHGWSCPGGHVEDGETPSEAAMRELAEETGLAASPRRDAFTLSSSYGCARVDGARHWTIGSLFVVSAEMPLVAEAGQSARWFALDRLPAHRSSDIDGVLLYLMRVDRDA